MKEMPRVWFVGMGSRASAAAAVYVEGVVLRRYGMPGIGCLPPTSGLTEVRKRTPRGPGVSFAVQITPL